MSDLKSDWAKDSFLIKKALKADTWRRPDPQIRAGDLRIPYSSIGPFVRRFSIITVFNHSRITRKTIAQAWERLVVTGCEISQLNVVEIRTSWHIREIF
ncbi:MAG: hypothetical protein AMJ56_19665 [Anaerolineae bacterium SG8_19]|nr:MAG: hypothetical protein AMJ56_19665 [Anaerolineae bacterium SG8_19]